MNLPDLYLKHFRKRAHKAWPVWEIGTDVACGDIGTFEDKQFIKTGSLHGRVPDAILKTEINAVPGQEVFSSYADIDISASAGGAPAPGVAVSGKVTFGKAGGVYFEANNLVEVRLAELGAVREAVRASGVMEKHEVFVSNVWMFANATLLVADTEGWTLEVSGKMPPIPAKLADASVSLRVTKGTGYKREITGDSPEHPMGVRLQGRRGWFSDRMTTLDKGAAPDMSEFVDVTAAGDD